MRFGIAVKKLHPDMCKEMDELKERLEHKISEMGVPDARVTDAQVSKILSDRLKGVNAIYTMEGDKRKRKCKVITELSL